MSEVLRALGVLETPHVCFLAGLPTAPSFPGCFSWWVSRLWHMFLLGTFSTALGLC